MKDQIKENLLPILVTVNCLFLTGFITYFLNLKVSSQVGHKHEVLGASVVSASVAPTTSPTPSSSPLVIASSSPIPQSTKKPVIKSTPTPTSTPSSSPPTSSSITNNYITEVVNPTPTPTPTPTVSPTPALSIINVELQDPAGDSKFNVEVQDGINACDLLVDAKDQGKISSVTLDDSYLATYKTLLVKEINGFKDNWVFTVNGDSPMGCSLVNLKNNDQIVWQFLQGGQ